MGDFDADFDDNNSAPSRSRPARRSSAASYTSETSEGSDAETANVDRKKRGIALMGDVILSFGLSLIIVPMLVLLGFIVPHIAKIVTQDMIIIAIMLVRDYFYQGRGFGKNLMGLQVVDATTGQPPSLLQSVKRNILFFLPLIVTGIFTAIKFLPFSGNVNAVVFQAVGWVCTAYVIILIPAECWYAYMKPDGRRIGDKFANTVVVESSMDFSKAI